MIDTHAHLNMDDFNDDMDQVIKRAKENGLSHIIVIGMDHKSSLRAIELAETYDMVYATVGLHPGYVDEGDLDFIKPLLKHPKVLGIGECGLDFYWRKDNEEKQREAFKYQIELAKETGLPLVIHTRNSFVEAYEMVSPLKGEIKGVFHCFSSDVKDAIKTTELGFYVGIDGPITYKKNEDLIDIVKAIDLNYLLIETDSPFLTPTPLRGKRNEPGYVKFVLEKLANVLNIDQKTLDAQTTHNTHKLFNLGGKNT
jgi:TatD DNase family protein